MPDNSISEDDKALFRAAIGQVKPLDQTKKITASAKIALREAPLVKLPLRKPREQSKINETLSNYYTETVHAETVLSYCQYGIPPKRLSELKNGKILWQSRIDLHGLTTDSARENLCRFIEQQLLAGNRCLLIIHGKGEHQGQAPTLKNLVNHWLKQLPQILAFHSAQPRDGGNGALYALLKRQR